MEYIVSFTMTFKEQCKDTLSSLCSVCKVNFLICVSLALMLSINCFFFSLNFSAGYVWGYNTQNFFNEYHPDVSTGRWLSWIPLVGGSIGVIFGGFISDRIVKRSGPVARIWVLISSLVRTPFKLPKTPISNQFI